LHTLSTAFPTLYGYIDLSNGTGTSIGNVVIGNFPEQSMQLLPLPNTDMLYTDDKNPADALRVEVIYGKE
jgi:hypothetical protein